MALPTTGTITLAQVNAELGNSSTAAISLNDAAVRALAGVASGAISMSDFYGKSAIAIVNSDYVVSVEQLGLASEAWLSFDSDGGTAKATGFGTSAPDTDWIAPTSAGIGSSYEIQYSGLVDGSGTGTFTGYTTAWQGLDAATYPTLARTSYGTSTASYTYSIREVGTVTVLGTAEVNLTSTSIDLGIGGG